MGNIYCIMNHKKVKCADNIRGLQAEANREYEDETRYRNKVDLSKSYQNVTLIHSNDWRKSIKDVIAKAGLSADKDSVLAISTVYTASPEWFEAHPDKEEQIAYFKDCLAYHEKHFGKVFSAVIHYDETTPHMQVISVPVIEVPKVENYWVCNADGKKVTPDDKERWGTKDDRKRKQKKVLDANGKPVMSVGLNGGYALGGKTKLSRLQTEFAMQVGKLYGMERGKCRVDSDEQVEHQTALQHDIEEMEEEKAKMLEDAKVQMNEIIGNAKKQVNEEREKLSAEKEAATQYVIDTYIDMQADLDVERMFANKALWAAAFFDVELQIEQHELEHEKQEADTYVEKRKEEAEREVAKVKSEADDYAENRKKEADDLKAAVASEKASYEQKNEKLGKLIAEGTKLINSPSSVSDDNDLRRKAYMETITVRGKDGTIYSAEERYQRELIRKKQAETESKAKTQAFIGKAEKVRKANAPKKTLAENLAENDSIVSDVEERERYKKLGKSCSMER